jgi:hypothetical protein
LILRWFLPITLLILLLARLVRVSYRPPLLTTYLLFRLLQYVGLFYLHPGTNNYRQLWLYSEVAMLVLLVLSAVECYVMITREIYELGSIGKIVMAVAIGLAVGVALTTGADSSGQWSARLALALELKLALLTFLTVALVAVVWFYRRFPIPVASHVWPHVWVFVAYLAFHSVGYWGIVALGNQRAPMLDGILTWVWCGCLAAWLWVYMRPSEPKLPPSDEKLNEANRRAKQMERTVDQ